MPQNIHNILLSKLKSHNNEKVVQPGKKIFKARNIEINGVKFRVEPSETLKTLANKINAKRYITKVEAEVVFIKRRRKAFIKV